MILLDEVEGSSKLAAPAATLRRPETVAGRSASPLPDYETSQAQQHTAALESPTKPSFPKRFGSRFWRVTFFALAIYVFLSVVIGIPVIVTQIAFRKAHTPPPVMQNLMTVFLADSNQAAPPLNFPSSEGSMIMAESSTICDTWDSKTIAGSLYVATARHTLDAFGLLSVRSNATDEIIPHPGGMHNLTVGINDDRTETDVTLAVSLTSSSAALRERAHVCFAYNGTNRGVSVYLPDGLSPSDVLAFNIRLLFPHTSRVLTFTDLITYLPMFQQSFGYISPNIRIQNINVAGAGLNISCDSFQANKIAVSTSFASITGSFNATQSIKLDNINGPITSNVTLYNDPSTNLATYLAIDSGNSPITTYVTMVGPAKSLIKPMFNIGIQTFGGDLSANVGHDSKTPPAALQLYMSNNEALTHVQLDSKFMGIFDLRTKLGNVTLDSERVMDHGKDPTGAGRSWGVALDAEASSLLRGWFGYGPRPKTYNPMMDGAVSVGSSLGQIVLEVVP
ncbi:hypothetical protein B0H16DRAFT_1555690 [Mycena metata]|uniref:Uncharacterized protein n=1 Tax=Mycena metata TaxID=1033252 RepID=A0AAD7IRI8_9AGAR|nr:hypothetical protein B0H16DRAFT_1555690 [Mycena metata]